MKVVKRKEMQVLTAFCKDLPYMALTQVESMRFPNFVTYLGYYNATSILRTTFICDEVRAAHWYHETYIELIKKRCN